MSRSEARLKAETTPATDLDADTTIAALDTLAARADLSSDDVRAIVSAATRLYARASTQAGHELPPLSPDVSTTEAITLACALLRSQDLTPFEMAMWFSRGAKQE
jgi:hypothetical protein